MSKTAIVLFNLGGPDKPEAVKPFLFNLFNDPAIIGLPTPLRWLVAKVISSRRAPIAQEIYAHLGGGSPLLPNTEAQALALQSALGADFKTFIAMRYWHPRSDETAAAVKAWGPDRIVLLPLYPQFSTTTTASSIADWGEAARTAGLNVPTQSICCYPTADGFVSALADRIRPRLAEARTSGTPRLLLTAHGLPKKTVAKGDPYQWQVEQTADRIVQTLAIHDLDWVVCYQSRVGPLEWIGPATEDEIQRAGRDGVPVVMAPIAFVSEHSETLVELDIEYGNLATECGVPAYLRVPTVDAEVAFIQGLAGSVRDTLASSSEIYGEGRCPASFGTCPCLSRVATTQQAA